MSHHTMLTTYVTVCVCYKLKTSWKSGVFFTNNVGTNSRYFVGVFNKTIILLVLACWIWNDHSKLGATHLVGSTISYPTRTRRITVKYSTIGWSQQIDFYVQIHEEIALQILSIFSFILRGLCYHIITIHYLACFKRRATAVLSLLD